MSVMRQIRDDEPLMIAWKAYLKTEDYQSTFKWLDFEEHRDGSMWGVFMAGFRAAAALTNSGAPVPRDGGAFYPTSADLLAVVKDDGERCPKPDCRGALDTGWECNSCGYDAKWIVDRHNHLADVGDRMHPSGLYFGEMSAAHAAPAPSDEACGELRRAFGAGWDAKARDVRDQLSDYDVDEAWEEFYLSRQASDRGGEQ